jgi:hypothetical protein
LEPNSFGNKQIVILGEARSAQAKDLHFVPSPDRLSQLPARGSECPLSRF